MPKAPKHFGNPPIDKLLLLIYAACTGAIATSVGLFVAASSQSRAATTIWLGTTFGLVLASGLAAVPLLRLVGQQRADSSHVG